MPYARPTLTDLFDMALQDIQATNISGVDGLLQRSVLRVLTRAISGLAYEHYGYQDWIARQAVPWTATDEFLDGWAALKGVYRKAATTAVLTATFTGTGAVAIPAGTTLSTANSLGFVTTSSATPAAGGTAVTIAASGTGTGYNLSAGTAISLGSVIPGVNSAGSIAATVTAAADVETDPELQTRMLQVYASPPQGGAQSDYVTWALAVPGVTRAWCNPNGSGAGTVVVYTMFDDVKAASGGFPQGTNGVATSETRDTPATGDQLTVANALYPLRPVTALVYSVAAIPQPIPLIIANLSPNTPAMLTAIESVLTNMFFRLGSPLGMTLYPSDCDEALLSVSGIGHFTLVSPAAPVAIPVGYLPEMGTVSVSS